MNSFYGGTISSVYATNDLQKKYPNNIYDIIYDDYDVPTRNGYRTTTYDQEDVSICNRTIELPTLSLRTLQNQIIPYWFKYMETNF